VVIELVREDVVVHLHALQAVTEQFQLRGGGISFGKSQRYSEVTNDISSQRASVAS
jgi:hypothetical protein